MTSARAIHRTDFTATRTHVPFRIEVASSLKTFAGQWPTTAERGDARCHPFQCADILQIWIDTIGRANAVDPVFARVTAPDGDPLFLLALGIEKSSGTRVLRFLDGGVSDYNAPVVYPRAASIRLGKNELWQQLQTCLPSFDLAALEKMPEQVDELPNPLAAIATASHPESCHGIALHGAWDSFAQNHLPNLRDSRRRLRKLEERSSVRFEIARTDNQRRQFFEALVRMKRQRFADTAAIDIFAETEFWQFYAEATRQLGSAGTVQLSALFADDQIIAADWGIACRGRYYDLVPSYESGEWRAYAPGRLLTEWLLRHHLERGDRVFDYGIGDEAYKFDYCNLHTKLLDAHIPATLKGAAYNFVLQGNRTARSKLRNTRVGTALKFARSILSKVERSSRAPGRRTLPAWLALLGSATLAVDA